MDNRLVAELKSQRNVIGSVGYWMDDEGHYCIDYDFNPGYGGKGYATEASNALIQYLPFRNCVPTEKEPIKIHCKLQISIL